MLDIDIVSKFRKGDMIVLRDFHTLSANDGEELSAEIKNVRNITNNALTIYGLEFDVNVNGEEATFMIMVRFIQDSDGGIADSDVRMFREWDSEIFEDFAALEMFSTEGTEISFVDFSYLHAGDEDDGELDYGIKKPYPFWDANSNGSKVAICEYVGLEDDLDNYWAKHCFVEWHAYVGDLGEDGLVTVWFGWDIGLEDIDVLKA